MFIWLFVMVLISLVSETHGSKWMRFHNLANQTTWATILECVGWRSGQTKYFKNGIECFLSLCSVSWGQNTKHSWLAIKGSRVRFPSEMLVNKLKILRWLRGGLHFFDGTLNGRPMYQCFTSIKLKNQMLAYELSLSLARLHMASESCYFPQK